MQSVADVDIVPIDIIYEQNKRCSLPSAKCVGTNQASFVKPF